MRTALLALLFVSGCATVQTSMGQQIDPVKIAKLEIGKTTKAEALSWFGNPHSISTTAAGGEVYKFVYMDSKASVKPWSFVLPSLKTELRYQELNITFKDDIVVDFTSTRR